MGRVRGVNISLSTWDIDGKKVSLYGIKKGSTSRVIVLTDVQVYVVHSTSLAQNLIRAYSFKSSKEALMAYALITLSEVTNREVKFKNNRKPLTERYMKEIEPFLERLYNESPLKNMMGKLGV